ncbi:MAG TPA: hypothetical protein VFD92_00215 [Candidatus Binatia bacterium]|nr:hypothetical protein [Candidatus Binatia bacterium]
MRRDAEEEIGGRRSSAEATPHDTRCDACGSPMIAMGHCKWLCRRCGFLRTCIDTV